MPFLEITQTIFLLFWQGRKGTLGESAHPGGVSAPRGSQRTLGESAHPGGVSQRVNFFVNNSIFEEKNKFALKTSYASEYPSQR